MPNQLHVVSRMWVASGLALGNTYRRGSDKVRCCVLRWHGSGDPELGLDHATGFQPIPQARVARLEMDKELSMGQSSHYDRGQGMRPC